jgi:hypothetical protein
MVIKELKELHILGLSPFDCFLLNHLLLQDFHFSFLILFPIIQHSVEFASFLLHPLDIQVQVVCKIYLELRDLEETLKDNAPWI